MRCGEDNSTCAIFDSALALCMLLDLSNLESQISHNTLFHLNHIIIFILKGTRVLLTFWRLGEIATVLNVQYFPPINNSINIFT